MSSIGTGLSSIGGAVSDLFASEGSGSAASAYSQAATIATQNEQLTQRSTAIQEQQAGIQTYQALGTEQADVAGAGMTAGGTAGSLLRASGSQAALSKQLIENQGQVTSQGYAYQASAYAGQAEAAQAQKEGQVAGGVLSAAGGIADLVGGSSGGSSSILSTVGSVVGDVASFLAWVICTELMRQGRMPKKYWATGSRVFANYPEAVKEGYYVWAVPSVRHLRAHPRSLYSRFLATIFNWRAEHIAAHAGVPGAKYLLRGAAVTVCLWPLCYAIGAVRLVMKRTTNWSALYGG